MNPLQCKDGIEQTTRSPHPPQFQAPTLQIVSDGDSDNEGSDSLPMASGETRRYPARSHHPPACYGFWRNTEVPSTLTPRLVDFVRH